MAGVLLVVVRAVAFVLLVERATSPACGYSLMRPHVYLGAVPVYVLAAA